MLSCPISRERYLMSGQQDAISAGLPGQGVNQCQMLLSSMCTNQGGATGTQHGARCYEIYKYML